MMESAKRMPPARHFIFTYKYCTVINAIQSTCFPIPKSMSQRINPNDLRKRKARQELALSPKKSHPNPSEDTNAAIFTATTRNGVTTTSISLDAEIPQQDTQNNDKDEHIHAEMPDKKSKVSASFVL